MRRKHMVQEELSENAEDAKATNKDCQRVDLKSKQARVEAPAQKRRPVPAFIQEREEMEDGTVTENFNATDRVLLAPNPAFSDRHHMIKKQ